MKHPLRLQVSRAAVCLLAGVAALAFLVPSSVGAHAGGLPLAGKVVAIDPGHNPNNWKHLAEIGKPVPAGGFLKTCDTTGTESANGYTEAAFNFDVATRLAHILKTAGATVVLTRSGFQSAARPWVYWQAWPASRSYCRLR